MKSIAILTAALLTAGAAHSQDVSAGKAQIAAALGLDASQYSLAELSVIAEARRDNDREVGQFYVSGANRTVSGGIGEVSPGKAQIAAQLGLDPAEYTLTELGQIETALKLDRDATAAHFVSHRNRDTRGAAGEVSPGKAQLAAALGVDADDFSLAELSALNAARRLSAEK